MKWQMKKFNFQKRWLPKKFIGLCVLLTMMSSLISCGFFSSPLPEYTYPLDCYCVDVADGPEDFVLDEWSGTPRLLVSSHERRGPAPSGDIYYFNLATGYSSLLKRIGEPESLLAFKPHGMDILRMEEKTWLYVILHDPYNRSKSDENAIGIYEVTDNHLKFKELLEDEIHLWSPNDLSVLPGGEIYATNDKRGKLDVYLKMETSEIVYYNPEEKQWSVVASDLSYANGILARDSRVFVSATRSDNLMEYPRNDDGTLGDGRKILDVKGPDNIMPFKNRLLLVAHFDDIAFLKHQNDKEEHSPSVVFLVDPDAGPDEAEPGKNMKAIYVDDGSQISAASTAFIWKGKLYISQVFN
jgi:hypothetical protein